MLQGYKEVLMSNFVARLDAERGYNEGGSLCGRISSVRSVYIWPRSPLDVGRRKEHYGRYPCKLINCRSCAAGSHWIRTELAHKAVYKGAPADDNTTV